MGMCSSAVAGIGSFVAARRMALQAQRGAHQPNAFLVRLMQILRHPLSVAQIGDFQLVAQNR
jgi:hypothetical protein